MFAAKDESGKLVYAILSKDNQQNYYCTECGEPMKLIRVNNRRSYFCHYGNRTHIGGETPLHKLAKDILKQDFEKIGYNTKLEAFTENEQRIDVLATSGNRKIAVEFQQAPIKIAELRSRVIGYDSNHYQNLWILNTNYFRKRMSTRQLKFLNYNASWQWHLIFLDTRKHLYTLVYNLKFKGVMNNRYYRIKKFADLNKLRQFKPRNMESEVIVKKTYTERFKKYCYANRIDYLRLESVVTEFTPVLKYDLAKTITLYQRHQDIEELLIIPANIQIKPQLTETVITEVHEKLDRLLFLIE